MQTQDAVLVDVRTEAARVANGVAELRRGALGKGAAVPPVRVRQQEEVGGHGGWSFAPCWSAGLLQIAWGTKRAWSECCSTTPVVRPSLAQLLPSVARRVRDSSAVALEIQVGAALMCMIWLLHGAH